jgi:chromosome segregation ATPase
MPAFAQTGGQSVDREQGQTKEQEEEKHFLYKWTDSKGKVHITDQPGTVPERYRSTVQKVEAPPEEETESSLEQRSSRDSDISDNEEKEADLKETWQQRMKDAKQHLADLEKQYQALDQKRNEVLGRWGGVASGHLEDKEEAERITQEMKQVQQEISDARNQIDVVIPDEARKAGIPPGWLRE